MHTTREPLGGHVGSRQVDAPKDQDQLQAPPSSISLSSGMSTGLRQLGSAASSLKRPSGVDDHPPHRGHGPHSPKTPTKFSLSRMAVLGKGAPRLGLSLAAAPRHGDLDQQENKMSAAAAEGAASSREGDDDDANSMPAGLLSPGALQFEGILQSSTAQPLDLDAETLPFAPDSPTTVIHVPSMPPPSKQPRSITQLTAASSASSSDNLMNLIMAKGESGDDTTNLLSWPMPNLQSTPTGSTTISASAFAARPDATPVRTPSAIQSDREPRSSWQPAEKSISAVPSTPQVASRALSGDLPVTTPLPQGVTSPFLTDSPDISQIISSAEAASTPCQSIGAIRQLQDIAAQLPLPCSPDITLDESPMPPQREHARPQSPTPRPKSPPLPALDAGCDVIQETKDEPPRPLGGLARAAPRRSVSFSFDDEPVDRTGRSTTPTKQDHVPRTPSPSPRSKLRYNQHDLDAQIEKVTSELKEKHEREERTLQSRYLAQVEQTKRLEREHAEMVTLIQDADARLTSMEREQQAAEAARAMELLARESKHAAHLDKYTQLENDYMRVRVKLQDLTAEHEGIQKRGVEQAVLVASLQSDLKAAEAEVARVRDYTQERLDAANLEISKCHHAYKLEIASLKAQLLAAEQARIAAEIQAKTSDEHCRELSKISDELMTVVDSKVSEAEALWCEYVSSRKPPTQPLAQPSIQQQLDLHLPMGPSGAKSLSRPPST